MRKILPNETKIKFSGGIRTIDQIKELKGIVDRIGTSIIPQ
jgi:deoxyribose-phosphate aldolase